MVSSVNFQREDSFLSFLPSSFPSDFLLTPTSDPPTQKVFTISMLMPGGTSKLSRLIFNRFKT